MKWTTITALLLSLTFLGLACESDSGDKSGKDTQAATDTGGADAAVGDTGGGTHDVEAETGATPSSNKLESNHAGWKKPACWTCHSEDDHNGGLDPYDCASCHGTNGAPEGHSDGDCASCHPGQHGGDGFPAPLACETCHPKP